MDTGSHLLFGATLAGLAMLHPEVAGSPALQHAMLTATMIGSHAPDFDTVARLRGYTAYIRTHRGLTHSLPALFIWPLLLALPIAYGFGVWEHVLLLYVWSFAAVFFHVFLDWFNAYGVQCFRPFSRKWQHLDVLTLFEPFLFVIHAAGLVWWIGSGSNPGLLFLGIYIVTFLYITVRTIHHGYVVRRVREHIGVDGICHVVPSLHWLRWQFVLESDSYFYTGVVRGKTIEVKDMYEKQESDVIIEATKAIDGVRAFLQFAQRIHVCALEKQDGYVVQWRDVRFWHNHQLPFGVDVKLDRDMQVISHSLGWKKKAWDPPYV
ncbi:metal-dependent hydrolase [Paenibacillus sp. YYML68]|uniref:metal-dependent hydrolase n=1 Tax=Paenibacillus sp. YYML68 TaxID=2909250 RepID=UPI00248F8FE7|nr:metal-dependent hydrolase [Paenibacillus sp. YYML68]